MKPLIKRSKYKKMNLKRAIDGENIAFPSMLNGLMRATRKLCK